MAQKRLKFSDQLRQIIHNGRLSRYRISKETGIDQTTLSRFMLGERGLTMKCLDKLTDFLKINLVVDDQSLTERGKTHESL